MSRSYYRSDAFESILAHPPPPTLLVSQVVFHYILFARRLLEHDAAAAITLAEIQAANEAKLKKTGLRRALSFGSSAERLAN